MSYSAAISHSQRNWENHRPKCQRWDDMHRGSRDCHGVGPAFGLCLGCGDVGADRGTRDSPPRTTLRGSHKWAIERGIARVSSRTKGAEWSSRCCLSVCARPLWQTRGCEGAEPLHANRQRSGEGVIQPRRAQCRVQLDQSSRVSCHLSRIRGSNWWRNRAPRERLSAGGAKRP
jgi:hypothetical protein